MNPLLKYIGGKSREIERFAKYIPKSYSTYIEPFLGGGALYFYLEPQKAIINDINEKLIAFYNDVRDNFSTLRDQLEILQDTYENNQKLFRQLKADTPERVKNKNEALYYTIRDMYNGKIPSVYLEGVLYYFINKTAYSGMIRYNQSGEYNVPFGHYPNFNTKIITEEHSKLLQNAVIHHLDYSCIFDMATTNDFMFLDPPYDCIFNDYGNIGMLNGFDEEQHRRLANDFRNLKCKTMMVIGKTPLTEELYGDYIVDEYYKKYVVNIKNRFKAEAKHIVVLNYKI